MDEVMTIFSAFDDKIGQVPLICYGIGNDRAFKICNQISMSILATVTDVPEPASFKGESIIPLVEDNLVATTYYFYMQSDAIKEPSFSFLCYLLPLSQRGKVYANIDLLAQHLHSMMKTFQVKVHLEQPLQEKTEISIDLKLMLKELTIPLEKLLASAFRATSEEIMQNVNFVESMAVTLYSNMDIEVLLEENITKDQVKNITIRLMLGILSRLSDNNEGEAILPVVERNLVAFSYFFPIKNKIGVLLLFSNWNSRMSVYRWAPLLANECYKIAKEIKNVDLSSNGIPKTIHKKLANLYFFEILVKDYLQRKVSTAKKSQFIDHPATLLDIKNIDRLFYSLIAGRTVFIAGMQKEELGELITFLEDLIPHRDMIVEETKADIDYQKIGIYHVTGELPKRMPEKSTALIFDKKKIQSTAQESAYLKMLITKKLKNEQYVTIKETMKKEILYLLDQVDQLVATAKMEDANEVKKQIDAQILKLPHKDMFDIIKDLAISYNPILAKLIAEKAVYTIRSEIWGI